MCLISVLNCLREPLNNFVHMYATGNVKRYLFVFIRYLGMKPVNNESERMLRKVVIYRKVRQKMVIVGGNNTFGTIMTHLLTWDTQEMNWFAKLSKVFWST